MNTPLQAVAVRISLHNTIITLCSMYLPPTKTINDNCLNDLISQLPLPFILAGDFNAHSTTWGCNDTNRKGQQIENFIINNSFINDPTIKTYLHPALLPHFSWKVAEDSSGSNHFPIFITEDKPSVLKR